MVEVTFTDNVDSMPGQSIGVNADLGAVAPDGSPIIEFSTGIGAGANLGSGSICDTALV